MRSSAIATGSTKTNDLWLSYPATCLLCGKSPEWFRQHIEPKLGNKAKRRGSGKGRPWEFYAPSVVQALLEKGQADWTAISGGDPDLIGDSDNPSLERVRRLKCDQMELDLAERRGNVIPRDRIHQALTTGFGIIRAANEKLQRAYGLAAADLLNDAIDDAERESITVLIDGIPGDIRSDPQSDQPAGDD